MKYLSLFSGIGGFEYGLQMSNHTFTNVGFSEIDKYAKSIYLGHFPRHKDLGDASEIDPTELQDFDLLVGGFPCQAFSLSGKRQGFDDTRGTLFFEIARICAEKQPRYLLLENVKGLLSHDGGRTYKKMLGVLSELGYDVEWEVLNSKSFGVPQNRERLYIKGYFRAKCGREILSQKRNSRETDVQIISHYFQRQVKKRVHSVDTKELSQFLRKHKEDSGLTYGAIAAQLGKPKTEVEHWFRTDDFFAPPTDDIWLQLKQMLGIESDKYDDYMLEFEWVDGVYEQDKRASDINGISSTLTTKDESLIVDPDVKVIGTTSPSGHWGKRVYGSDGISPTLCSQSLHKNGLRVMLDDEYDDPKVKVVGNVSNTGHNGENVLDKNGVSSTITATNYKHPIKIIEDDFEVEKVYGSNQKHRAETDGSYSPTIVSCGGSNLPRVQFNKPIEPKTDTGERKIIRVGNTNGHQSGEIYGVDGVSPTLCGFDKAKSITKIKEPIKLKTNTDKGYDEVTDGDGVRLCHPSSTKARGRTQKGQTGALSTSNDWGTVDRDYRIRRLTPRECERLQAFPDDWTKFGKDGEIISDTQRYKCLGNAVTTSVVTYLANTMFGGYFEE